MFQPEVNDAIQKLSEDLAGKYPEVAVLLDQLRNGDIGEVEAMGALMNLVAQEGIGPEIQQMAETAFGAAKIASTGITVPPLKGPLPPVVITGSGLPRLNPLLEGAIAERVQFDGDVPELRSGPMAPDTMPAVPVDTLVRNPVALGVMLGTASEEVARDITEAQVSWQSAAKQIAETAEAEGLPTDGIIQRVKSQLPAPPTGIPGYQPGQVPALRAVSEPVGSALAAMTPEQKKEAAYKALSSTQGRQSAVRVIEELILVGLEGEGFKMGARTPSRVRTVPVHAQWTVNLSGPKGTQSNFSFIDLAAKVMLRKLVVQLVETTVPDPVLEVMPVSMVDIRKVGWAARVVPTA